MPFLSVKEFIMKTRPEVLLAKKEQHQRNKSETRTQANKMELCKTTDIENTAQ